MTAMLIPVGPLKSYLGGAAEVSVEAQNTVRNILIGQGIPPELVALITVNGSHQDKDYFVEDGDQIKIIAVLGGG